MDGSPPAGYRIAGEGKELFTRFQIRDKIRAGEVTSETSLALEGSEEYRAAATYPELTRYLSLITGQPATAPSGARGMLMPSVPAAPPTSVASRIAPGLVYPFTGVGWLVLLVATALEVVPVAGWVASAFLKVYQLAAIRASTKGATRMPRVGEVGEVVNAIFTFLKIIVVGIASVWPLVVVPLFVHGFLTVWAGTVLFTLLYAPAAFALLARTDSIGEAINPAHVLGLMQTLGSDYFIAFAGLMFALVLGFFASAAATRMLLTLPGHFYIVRAIRGFFGEWGFFYFAHLVGWAMYRRT